MPLNSDRIGAKVSCAIYILQVLESWLDFSITRETNMPVI